MIIVKHKVNTLLNLDKIPKNYGVEVDIRLNNKKFILSHYNNSQKNKTYLGKFLKKFNHSYLILNLKEQHLAKKLLNFMKKKKIKNFFLLDLFPHEIIKIKSKKTFVQDFHIMKTGEILIELKNFLNGYG